MNVAFLRIFAAYGQAGYESCATSLPNIHQTIWSSYPVAALPGAG